MSLEKPALRAHKPSGQVPAPFVLLEGEEKAGKTWAAVLLSADPRIGATYFLDLGEGTAEEYGRIPGARFEVIEHDGTYVSVLEQVLAVKAEAERAHKAGEPPVALIVDTMGDIWDGLKDWVSERARGKESNKRKLAADPGADIDVPRNLWNDASNRYHRIMNPLLTMPGIVVATARGKVVSATDPNTGQPYRDGRKEYRVEGEKNLAYQATAWVRMSRTAPPVLVGARSTYMGVKPGSDKPRLLEGDNLVAGLIFDGLRFNPADSAGRDMRAMVGGDLLPEEREEEQQEQGRPAPRQTRRKRELTEAEEIENWRQLVEHRNSRRSGPPLAQATARAWDALTDIHPDWPRDRREAEFRTLLGALGTTPADADPTIYTTITEQLETEMVVAIHARHSPPERPATEQPALESADV